MGKLQHEEGRDVATQARRSRVGRLALLATALVLAIVGTGAFIAPRVLALSLERFLGIMLLICGLLEAVELLLARFQFRTGLRASVPMWSAVLFHIPAGIILLLYPRVSLALLIVLMAVLLIVEGALILYLTVRLRGWLVRVMLLASGGASIAAASVSLWHFGQPSGAVLVAYLLGAKFLMLAFLFASIALFRSHDEIVLAFGGNPDSDRHPRAGSIYAVFYGPAFHCGIYVGQQQIVDYLTDGKVRLISWDEFLLGREPQPWDYPDVPAAPIDEIIEFARALVGKQHPYDALQANCENVAIYCRSAGRTHQSQYAQAAVGLEMVRKHPLLGSMLQLVNRGAAWLAYMLGGAFGQRIAFYPVWLSNRTTDWLIVRPMRRRDLLSNE